MSTLDPRTRADVVRAAAGATAEWRADEAAWTATALAQWRHQRSLVDLAREHLHRGDTITVSWSDVSTTLTGPIVGVGTDVAALSAAGARVDVALGSGVPIVWRVARRAQDGGSRGHTLDSLRARLLELEACAVPVEVGLANEIVRGRLIIGRDHLTVTDESDSTTVLALSGLRYVRLTPTN